MSGWKKCKLSDIANFNPKRPIEKGSIAPFIEMASLPTSYRDIDLISKREFKGGGSRFKNGDTLFARITPCLENGKIAKVSGLPSNVCAHGSTEFIVMSAKDSFYDEDFIYYLVQLPEFREYAKSRMEGTSGRQRVSWQALAEFEYLFPNKGIRKKIGEILKTLDDKIAINQQINRTLEEMAQAVFKSWFVDFEPVRAKMAVLESGGSDEQANIAAMQAISGKTAEELSTLKSTDKESYDKLHHTATLFPSAMQDSELGEIPEGWEVKDFGDIITPKKGKVITKKTITEGEVPVVAGGLEPAYYHNQANVKAPVITVSASGANAGFVRLYHQDIWASDCSYINKTHTPFIYSIYTFLKNRQKEIFGMQQGAAQPHIYPSDLMRLKIISPHSKCLWEKIEEITCSSFQQIKLNIEQSQTLTQIRDTLLPKLLSGEIDVGGITSE